MTIISPGIYESLTPDQRISAAIAAIARGDDQETENLYATCPRKSYRRPDAAFGDTLEKLQTLSLAIESDLQGSALDFLLAARDEDSDEIHCALASIASIYVAWKTLLSERGIDVDEMTKASPARHYVVSKLISAATGREVPEFVEITLASMREFIGT